MFLSLPEHASLTRGHCILAPLEHIGAMTRVDENAVQEAYSFRRDLCRMAELWKGEGASCLFVEIGGYPNSYRHHCQIECFPVDRETMEELPSYYKVSLSNYHKLPSMLLVLCASFDAQQKDRFYLIQSDR